MLVILSAVFALLITSPRSAYGADSWHKNADLPTLRRLAAQFDDEAIFELGRRGDSASVSLLRQIAADTQITKEKLNGVDISTGNAHRSTRYHREAALPHGVSSYAARAVLTRMKAADYFGDFVVQLSTSSMWWKAVMIKDLGYIGDQRAIQYIGPYLFMTDCDDFRLHPHKICDPFAAKAAVALSNIIQPPFLNGRPEDGFLHTEDWQQWWIANRAQYGDHSPLPTK